LVLITDVFVLHLIIVPVLVVLFVLKRERVEKKVRDRPDTIPDVSLWGGNRRGCGLTINLRFFHITVSSRH
jgi:hypothetical protein